MEVDLFVNGTDTEHDSSPDATERVAHRHFAGASIAVVWDSPMTRVRSDDIVKYLDEYYG